MRDEAIEAAEPSTCSSGGGVLWTMAQIIARPVVRYAALMDGFMKLCRFTAARSADVRVGLITNGQTLVDLTDAGVHRMKDLLERADLADELTRLSAAGLTTHALDSVRLLTPVESQEVWAAGVTYLRSRDARMGESEFSASAYDRSTMPSGRRSSSSRFPRRSSLPAKPSGSGATHAGTSRSRSSRS